MRRPPARKHGRRAQRGPKFPLGTVAFYGPTADFASKVVAAVFTREKREAVELKRWYADDIDVRFDRAIGAEVTAFFASHGAKTITVTDGIIGCPHQEGIDFPEGETCKQCPYWAGRNRFTHERIN